MPYTIPLFGTRSQASTGDLDTMFQTVGLLGIIPCGAAGTNAIVLSPAVNTPVISAYQNNLSLGFVATATSTGAVTAASLGLPQLPVYLQDGVTQADAGSITIGTFYVLNYVSAYNGGGGGWSLTGNQPAASPDFSLLTTTDNPADTAFVAGTIGGGAGNNRKFRPGEVGGWSALDEKVAAGSASLDFNFSALVADFEDFEFVGSYLATGNDGVDAWVRTSADGTTFDSGAANYSWLSSGFNAAAGATQASTGDTKIILNSADTLGNSTQESVSFRLTLYNAGQTAAFTAMTWMMQLQSSVPRSNAIIGNGRRLAASAVKGLQFLPSAGPWATGKVSMLGRRKVI